MKLPPLLPRKPSPEVRRALNATTGKPIRKLTITQKTKLKAMEKILSLLSTWVVRYLLVGVSAAGALWNASPEHNQAVTSWLGGAFVFFVAAALRWVKNKWMGIKPGDAATIVKLLVLSALLWQVQHAAATQYQLALAA